MTLVPLSPLSPEFGRIVSECFDLTSAQVDAAFNQSAKTVQLQNVVQVALGQTQNYQPAVLLKSSEVDYLPNAPTHADLRPGHHSLSVSGTNQYVVFSPAQVNCGYLVKFDKLEDSGAGWVP
jgi:hypothetical protein